MTARYKAVIYDCDRVILDSIESNYIFYNRIMKGLGRPEIDRLCTESERVNRWHTVDIKQHTKSAGFDRGNGHST